jgi:hypothetical protein
MNKTREIPPSIFFVFRFSSCYSLLFSNKTEKSTQKEIHNVFFKFHIFSDKMNDRGGN